MVHVARFALIAGIAGAAMIPSLTGCDSLFWSRDCTLIGCGPQLTIQFTGAVPESFEAVVWATDAGDEPVAVCSGNCIVEEATPDEILIEIAWDEQSRSEVIRPDYEESRPNGPNCDPVCRTANVEVAF